METFASTSRAAIRENLGTAAVLLVAVPLALHFLRGERDPLVLAVAAVATALAGLLFYSLRDAWLGRHVVEITPAEIRVRGRRGERAVAWARVRSASRTLHGGEAWTLRPAEGAPLVVRLEGFTLEQAERIGALIRAHTAGETPPAGGAYEREGRTPADRSGDDGAGVLP